MAPSRIKTQRQCYSLQPVTFTSRLNYNKLNLLTIEIIEYNYRMQIVADCTSNHSNIDSFKDFEGHFRPSDEFFCK